MLAKGPNSTSSVNETVTPLQHDAKDFSDAEVAIKRFEAMKLRNPDYAKLTFEEGRQFFEQVKSEFDDIPASMTFEEALASDFLTERKKRSLVVSDDETYHANLQANGKDFANLVQLEKLRKDMIKVTLDLTTKELYDFLVKFEASDYSGFFNYPIPVTKSLDTESLRHKLISAISHWTHFELNEIEKQLEEEIEQLKKRDKRSLKPSFFNRPQCQIDESYLKLSKTPFILIGISSSLGLLASLILCCKAFCCKN